MNNLLLRGVKFLNAVSVVADSVWVLMSFIFMQCVLFFQPVMFNIYLVGFLIAVDVITALIALFMQCKRDCPTLRCAFASFYTKWTSKRAFDSVPKFIWYGLMILLSHCVGMLYDQPQTTVKLASAVIAYVEIRSIIENGDKAFGTNIWELVVDGARKFFKLK